MNSISFVQIVLAIFSSIINSQAHVPYYLQECYKEKIFKGPQLPMNLQIFIDIIRKVEKASQTTMDLRGFSSSMLHRFKFDGIEHNNDIQFAKGILPFVGTGPQRAKNQIIEDLVPGNYKIFPHENLTIAERCLLHKAISNTIWDHENPEGDKFCMERPMEKISSGLIPKDMMKCPLEFGVILTPYGTLAPGALIAAIAAALQPQKVAVKLLLDLPEKIKFNEDEVDLIFPQNEMTLEKSMWLNSIRSSSSIVDNIWASTIAGDLAEMAIHQGPRVNSNMVLGATGFWNSTMRNQIFYLLGKDGTFDATRSEIIGDIDAFIIAKNLKLWTSQFSNIRLSQILDIYYSSKRTVFNSNIKACTRGKAFWNVASRKILEDQVFAVSQVLAYRGSIAHLSNQALRKLVNQVVQKFTDYANNHLFTELHCQNEKQHPTAEVLVTLDGAWTLDYTSDFLAVLLEDLDVSLFGSKIGILHGITGNWILNMTNSPAVAHQAISNLKSIFWPTGMNLSKIFIQADEYFTKKWEKKSEKHNMGDSAQVILVLAPLAELTSTEQQFAITSLLKLREKHPDIEIIYYITEKNIPSFQNLLLTEEDYLISSSKINDITDYLMKIPRSLRLKKCQYGLIQGTRDQIEEYIQPYETIIYRLDTRWKINTEHVAMSFVGVGYGSFEVCTWNQKGKNAKQEGLYCREVTGHSETTLLEYYSCKDEQNCAEIYYQIRGMSSLKKCAEVDCRTPEHIRYLMRLETLQCSNSSTFSKPFIIIIFFVLLIINKIRFFI